jgi:hypothetical protein
MLKRFVVLHCAVGIASGAMAQSNHHQPPLPVAPFSASASSVGPAVGASGAVERWEVMASDVTLARTFERWSLAAGHKLKWDAARNFLIGAPDVYVGTFEGAIEHVLRSPGIRYSDYPLEACVYANSPPLVRITRQGEQSRECLASTAP